MQDSPQATPDNLTLALELADTLERMLEDEFELLKQQKIEDFEATQSSKTDILRQLTSLTGVDSPTAADKLGSQWDGFKSKIMHCRDLHRRNEILIGRKIDALRGALQSLRVQDPASSVEVYDRLGQVSRNRRTRGYSEA
jgi:flagellar biosynthesis/type III secretory pathway chaperone